MLTNMSVPKDKRDMGQLAINTTARRICTHVLRITGNDKNFPPDQQWFLNRLRETALNIDLKCWRANNIYVKSESDYHNRSTLQKEAGDDCTDMLELINISKPLFHMSTKRYRYLTDQYAELRKDIRNWEKSDRRRYMP